jgi:hypothetical protein
MPRRSRRPFHWLAGALAVVLLALPSLADANTEPFEVDTTGDLLKACDWKENDPLYVGMVTFCLGYVSSAIQYDEALNPDQKDRITCPPGTATLTEAALSFIAWANANPGLHNELAVEGVMLAVGEKWPCKGSE